MSDTLNKSTHKAEVGTDTQREAEEVQPEPGVVEACDYADKITRDEFGEGEWEGYLEIPVFRFFELIRDASLTGHTTGYRSALEWVLREMTPGLDKAVSVEYRWYALMDKIEAEVCK